MPTVAPVAAPPSETSGPSALPVVPEAGFDQLLGASLGAARTVGLATMVALRSSTPAPAATAPVVAAAAATTTPLEPTAATVAPAPPGDAGRGSAAIRAGERYLGVPYRWGGTDPATGLDCSGFVQRAFRDVGVSLPRVSVDQAKQGQAVASLDQARPGDLVFWRGDGRRPNHIGIYAGDGRMLVAPRTGDVVKYQNITRPPDGIRRVV